VSRRVVVVLDRDRPGRLAYFKAQAERVARELDADGPFELHTGRQFVELAERFEERSVEHVIVCAHGGTDWLIHPRTGVAINDRFPQLGQVDVAELVAAWSPVMVDRVRWSLCACLCSRSPTWWLRNYLGRVPSTWGPRSYQRGGQGSFAARLRDMLVWWHHDPDVRAHKSAGDLLGNPLLSLHRWPAADQSIPLCQIALPEVIVSVGFRRWWVRTVRGRLAERWLLGDDSVVEEIATLWSQRAA
jgi:hypothetical protein